MTSESIERELAEVERQIGQLRVEYERFFTGDLKLLPVPARRRLEELLKRLGNRDVEKAVDRFRLQALQGRYVALTELVEKRLRAREEGRAIAGRAPVPAAVPPRAGVPAAAGPPGQVRHDAPAPAPVKGKEKADFRLLFDRYRKARQAVGDDVTRLQYERFEELVRKQAEELRRRTGATRLVFEIRTEEGKVRLVGRPNPGKG